MGSDHPTATGKGRVATTQEYSSEEISLMRELLCGLRRPTGNVASRQRIVLNPFAVKHTK